MCYSKKSERTQASLHLHILFFFCPRDVRPVSRHWTKNQRDRRAELGFIQAGVFFHVTRTHLMMMMMCFWKPLPRKTRQTDLGSESEDNARTGVTSPRRRLCGFRLPGATRLSASILFPWSHTTPGGKPRPLRHHVAPGRHPSENTPMVGLCLDVSGWGD